MSEISEAITENATGPKKVQDGVQSIEEHSLRDQVLADKHTGANAGVASTSRGLIFNKISAPGAA